MAIDRLQMSDDNMPDYKIVDHPMLLIRPRTVF